LETERRAEELVEELAEAHRQDCPVCREATFRATLEELTGRPIDHRLLSSW
jgi:hypothetical protein